MKDHNQHEIQMSEAFLNSAFLALSGGFQDAYTYNARNEVFCNAQTGNVVLMSQHFMAANRIQYAGECHGIFRLCNAGTVLPQGKRIFLCKYYVYR